MKPLLRKIFFWDEPAQGAMFGLTLLLAAVWFAFSLLCCVGVVHYPLLLGISLGIAFGVAALVLLGYIAFLLGRIPLLISLKTTGFWRRLWVPLVLFVLSLGYGAALGFLDEMYWKWGMFTALALGGVYLCCSMFFSSWKMVAGTFFWLGALLVFWIVFIYAFAPFKGSLSSDWSLESGSLCYEFRTIHKWFRLETPVGCFCFAASGFLLLVAGYFLYGSLLAGYAKISLRKLFSRKIRCVWGIVAGSYVVFLVLALWETAAYRRAVKDLEEHYGHPMTSAELERQFYDGRPANPEFWKELEVLLAELYDSRDEEERMYSRYPFAVLPDSLHSKWKRNFLENVSRQKLEQMISAPIPPPKRNYADDQLLMAMPYPEFADLRGLARMEMHHIGFSLEDDDLDAVSCALDRMDFCREYLWKDHSYIAYLVGIDVTSFRLQAMEKVLTSALPTEKWLTAQSDELAAIERQAEQLEKHFLYGESVCYLNLFHWLAHYSGYSGMMGDYPSGLNYHSLRFLFPQGWWLAANELKGMAKTLRVRHFSELPTSRTGYYGVDLLLPALSKGTVKKQSLIASSRVIRGLIQAELHKRRTGEYPDSIDDLPQDPFSRQTLKYRKGTCEVVQKICQEEVAKEIYQEKGKEKKNGAYCLYASPSLFVSQKRTLQAVQIWSVGPDGIDDGGIAHKPEYGSSEKKKDDIRFIIPIP